MYRLILIVSIFVAVFGARTALAQAFLFDATKAEMAANADWVIHAGQHNLGTDASGLMVAGAGNESNPQQIPTPAASGITSITTETYWNGALSAWGVSLVKRGKSVETLPYNGSISFGNSANPQDLSHYKVFVVDEPNIRFTAVEKAAMYAFIKAGNSIFAISDHAGSDRNNDGLDSVGVWNDFLALDGMKHNPLGITFNSVDVSPDSFAIDGNAADPITHGAAGTVSEFVYHNGATITIDPTANPSVAGAVWSATPEGNANVLAPYGSYGLGRFVAIGDSSPIEDGTGDPNDTLFDGWDEGAGNDGKLVVNASLYLTSVPEPCIFGVVGISTMMYLLSRRKPRAVQKEDGQMEQRRLKANGALRGVAVPSR
ncbi:MAG: C-terminal target protein [Phycisphaerales bacterium]|nr:C-terminal target protein [Phycisphaerales bacterium]